MRNLFWYTLLLGVCTTARSAETPVDSKGDPRDHWAFQAPLQSVLPTAGDAASDDVANPVDAFLSAKRTERGVQPVAPVDRRLLVRRLYLDLVGLPPTRVEMETFLADTRPNAYERLVDRLLASPQYGERWGRHFMDIWRYSDWFGLGKQLRYSQKHIWRWRDWIVESLNEDAGYDEMVRAMLAADELWPLDPDALRATGFLARNYFLFNRTTWLDATIEHTSKAFLGLTMNCVKCHAHKYDPIAHEDYYRFRAFFEPYQVRLDSVPGETDLEKDGLPRVFDAHPEAPTYIHVRGDAKNADTSRAIEPGVPGVLAFDDLRIEPLELPPEAYFPALRGFVLEDHLRAAEHRIAEAERAVKEAERSLAAAKKDDAFAIAELRRALALRTLAAARLHPPLLKAAHAADRALHGLPPPGAGNTEGCSGLVAAAALAARRYEHARADEAVVRAELGVLEAKEDEARKKAEETLVKARSHLEKARNALESPGEEYPSLRASLKALEGPDETDAARRKPYPKTSSGRRSALACWITDRRNPLTARVAVNHVWLRHFGQPLVEPVTDFGLRTPPPVHRELLDWLAVELMEHDWSLKHIHRLLVTSRTYRLSTSRAAAAPETVKQDPENALYWRRGPLRMESQVVRDSLLRLAEEIDLQLGGPTIDPHSKEPTRRRSLYLTHSRDDHDRFLAMFDDADILACYRRTESIVPQQALTLANSAVALRLGRVIAVRLAERLEHDSGAGGSSSLSSERYAREAFIEILCREPNDAELTACVETLDELTHVCREQGMRDPLRRARAGLVHALLNHNDFVTVR